MSNKLLYALGSVIAAIFLVALTSYTSISAGHIGVVRHFGAVTGKTFVPGLHWKIPIVETVEVIDVRLSSVDAKVNAGSRDQQEVGVVVSVQYFIKSAITPVMVDGLGGRDILEQAILENAIQESVKAVTAQYTAEELLTKRPEVKIGINKAV